MRVVALELEELSLELEHPVASSRGENRHRPVVLVHVISDEAEGYGECVALAEPTYSEEYAAGAYAVLAEVLIPRLLAGGPLVAGAAEVLDRLEAVRGHPMAKAALEIAFLDAELRAADRPLAEALGATRSIVAAGATVGLSDPDGVVAEVAVAVDAGYRRVKLKIAPGQDVAPVAAVRAAFPELTLSADANGAYAGIEGAARADLERLDEFALVALEQPLGVDDLLATAELSDALATPVLLDESVRTLGRLEAALALGAGDGLVVKPGPAGGVLAAHHLASRAAEAGWRVAIGGMFESGIGRAAALALAATPAFDLPGDLGASERYFAEDVCDPVVLEHGHLAVPSGPGLGITVDRRVLERHRLRSQGFAAS